MSSDSGPAAPSDPPVGPRGSSKPERTADEASLFGRELLRRVTDAARARGATPRARLREKGFEPRARHDSRDPVLVADSLKSLIVTRGWAADLSVASVTARWPQIAGAEIADHCDPVDFSDGVLTLKASSTAWATQLRLLSSQLLQAIARELGDGVVTEVRVSGPSQRSFRRGPRSVRGRGPRDTWG